MGARQALFRGANPAFDQIEAAIQAAKDTGRSRRASLRITMPGFAYDMVIAAKLRSFRETYPDIEVEISIDERFVNLCEERFHAGTRLGDRIDPDMIAIRIIPPLYSAMGSTRYSDFRVSQSGWRMGHLAHSRMVLRYPKS